MVYVGWAPVRQIKPMLIVTDQTSDERINKDWLAETKLGANQTEIQDLKIVSNC